MVSSPEGFRHGYFVVAILFSEQISLEDSGSRHFAGCPRESAAQGACRWRELRPGAPSRRWSPHADADSGTERGGSTGANPAPGWPYQGALTH